MKRILIILLLALAVTSSAQVTLPQYYGFAQTPAAAASSWDPSQLSTLAGWWRADLGVSLISGGVNVWADQSTSGNNLTYVAGTRPTVSTGVNGQPAIQFNGRGLALTSTINLSSTGAFYVILKTPGSFGSFSVLVVADRNSGQYLAIRPGDVDVNGSLTYSATINTNTGYIIGVSASGGSTDLYVNGVTTSGSSPTFGISELSEYDAQVGAAGFNFNGPTCEMLHVTSPLTGTDLSNWLAYVHTRYGL